MEGKTASKTYISRCRKVLSEIDAPLKDWFCIEVIDFCDEGCQDYATCELCGCNKVRFIHVMAHKDYHGTLKVGCICAGIMEGDLEGAKEREKLLKNKRAKKERFSELNWKIASTGNYYLKKDGVCIFINQSKHNKNRYGVRTNNKSAWLYKNKSIDSFKKATYAAFDLLESLKKEKMA